MTSKYGCMGYSNSYDVVSNINTYYKKSIRTTVLLVQCAKTLKALVDRVRPVYLLCIFLHRCQEGQLIVEGRIQFRRTILPATSNGTFDR